MRGLPSVDSLLKSDFAVAEARILGHASVAEICRAAVENARARALREQRAPDPGEIEDDIRNACKKARSKRLGKVINGTGVLLHTNLGRAPLGRALFEELAERIGGYCNLEIDVLERRRGVRGPFVSTLLSQLCRAEDAIVVNNNAAALHLILRELAGAREVIISRGELVQIGGGFRIPDILSSSGAMLKEVGTTNITTTTDYLNALNEKTAMILKVHQSNFDMTGFVKSPDIRELRGLDLGNACLVSDLGSGNLVRSVGDLAIGEPTPAEVLNAGADLVCFSCDKMLGGVQGGVIAGKAELIARLKKNPLMRVVRVDKLTYAALQVVLGHHLLGDHRRVLLWDMAAVPARELATRARSFLTEHGLDPAIFSVAECTSTFGGGSVPGSEIPSAGIRIAGGRSADGVALFFQEQEPPVVGTVKDGAFTIDFRTVFPEDQPVLAQFCLALQGEEGVR